MNPWSGPITIAAIFLANNNWKRYLAWKAGEVRLAVTRFVSRRLACRTAKLSVHRLLCPHCHTLKVIPHSCKSVVFCSSCGKVRTDQWCKELLSELFDVPYHHLVFTLPWGLRLLIQDNCKVLLNVLFKAAAEAVMSLTAGEPFPQGRKSRRWLEARRPCKRYRPGLIIVLHTFGRDLKWNPHPHVIITGGGLSLDSQGWVAAPKRYLLSAPLLGTEWKLNVIKGIRTAHSKLLD
jgi:hypothetical protein